MNAQTGTTPRPLVEQLRAVVFAGEVVLPPFPDFARKILNALEDPEQADVQEVADLVANEPAVAATLLKAANSAAFGGLKAIRSVPQAIVRLGLRQVASIVAALAHKGHFAHAEPERRRQLRELWDHAVATATVARGLAEIAVCDTDAAFLAGLLHDVGKLLVLRGVDHLQDQAQVEITPELLADLFAQLHTDFGYHLLQEWNLPEEICEVALRHHEETPDDAGLLLLCTQAANVIAHRMQDSERARCDSDLMQERAIELLSLSDVEIAELMVDLEDRIQSLHELL